MFKLDKLDLWIPNVGWDWFVSEDKSLSWPPLTSAESVVEISSYASKIIILMEARWYIHNYWDTRMRYNTETVILIIIIIARELYSKFQFPLVIT